jgi:hypothetical protein
VGHNKRISHEVRVARFWAQVEKTESCWLWKGGRDPHGYGQIHIGNKPLKAHHFSYQLTFGPIPPGLCILQRCQSPACVNPQHLFLGTQQENLADMLRKGRDWPYPPASPRYINREKVRSFIHQQGLTYDLLAHKMSQLWDRKISGHYVWELTTGHYPRSPWIPYMARALKVPLEDILQQNPNPHDRAAAGGGQ